jgi:DNA polymerase III subunit delta
MDNLGGNVEQSLQALLAELKKGIVAPCYLLYGDEEYLIGQALDKLVGFLLPEDSRDLNLFTMDGANEDIDELCDNLLMAPLFAGRKVVVVRNTRLFLSRQTLPELIRKIRDHLERDPDRAVKDFMLFLTMAGFRLDDLRDEGWKGITDDQWRKALGTDDGQDRETWLPRMVELCVNRGLGTAQTKEDTERLSDLLSRGLPEGNHLIFTADALDRRKKLFKVIADVGRIVHFPQVKGESKQRQMVMQQARERLAERGKQLTPGAWNALGARTGFDLRDSLAALDKLMTYTADRAVIEEADVEVLIGKTREDTLFELPAAMVEQNSVKALLSLKNLLEQGVNHLPIAAMITREVRFLLQAQLLIRSGRLTAFDPSMDYGRFQKVLYPQIKSRAADEGKKSGEKAGLAGQHPYVIYNALRNSGRFSYDSLLGYLEALVEMDRVFKTTARDPKLALERFIIAMCTEKKRGFS